MILHNMHTLTARRLLASTPSSARQFHVLSTSRILCAPSSAQQTRLAGPFTISTRDYSTPTRSTAAPNKSPASTPSPTQGKQPRSSTKTNRMTNKHVNYLVKSVTHQRKTDAPTISDRLSAEDTHKIEDWGELHFSLKRAMR